MNKKILLLFLLFAVSITIITGKDKTKSIVNLSHLNSLCQDVRINGIDMNIVYIYCEYPDYKWTDAGGEGITCVDDIARSAIVYMNGYNKTKNKDDLDKIKKQIRFIIYLQSENGFFYNFINKDYTINKNGNTSVNKPGWWSWRAMWGLSEAYNFFMKYDENFAKEIKPVLDRSVNVTIEWLNKTDSRIEYNGFSLPAFLPYETASDQAAIIIKSLVQYYKTNKSTKVLTAIRHLSDAVLQMQAGSKNEFPYCAFLSWQTSWHAWGNNQSEALIQVSKIINNKKYLTAALDEIDNYYRYLIKNTYLNTFEVEKKNNKINILKTEKYSQIAYGISPMILACIEAYNATGNETYAKKAVEISKWFFGGNIANRIMYNSENGMCYDGIVDSVKINKNSGAESTIEALIALQAIENNEKADKYLKDYLKTITKREKE